MTLARPFLVQLWDGQFVMAQVANGGFQVTYPGKKPIEITKPLFQSLYTGYAIIVAEDTARLPKITGPNLTVQEYVGNFGIADEGNIVEHTFTISNTGTSPLQIKNLRPTCGCVSTEIDKRTLQPGEQGKITLHFDTHGRFGKQSEGAYIHSNDPITPIVPLRMSGVLHSAMLTVSQRSLDFGTLHAAQGGTTELMLSDPADPTFQVKAVSSDSPDVKGTIFLPDKEHPTYRIRVALLPGIPIGDFSTNLLVETTHHRESILTIPIRAAILPNLDLLPELIHFGRIKQGETVTKQLVLTLYTPTPWKIEATNVPVDYITITKDPQKKDSVTLTCRLTEKAPVGVIKTQLVIRTTDPEYQEITIPIYGVVEE